jgi:hypothetical protein
VKLGARCAFSSAFEPISDKFAAARYDKKNPGRTNGRNGCRGRVWGTCAGYRDHTSFFPQIRAAFPGVGQKEKNGPLNLSDPKGSRLPLSCPEILTGRIRSYDGYRRRSG